MNDRQPHERGSTLLITVLTAVWLLCFLYLGLVQRLPLIPGITTTGDPSLATHFGASFVLALLVYELVRTRRPTWPYWWAASLAIGSTGIIGVGIELLQIVVPVRGFEARDIAFDLLGGLVAVAVILLLDVSPVPRSGITFAIQLFGVLSIAVVVTATVISTPAPFPTCQSVPRADSPAAEPPDAGFGDRVDRGLLALYSFDTGAGTTVPERTGETSGMDLNLSRSEMWLGATPGVLFEADLAATEEPATALSNAIPATDQFTVEAWVRPSKLDQDGPARIVTLSDGLTLDSVSFHLGQEGACLSIRVDIGRLAAKWVLVEGVFAEPQPVWHVVMVYEAGSTTTYVDGQLRDRQRLTSAHLQAWDQDYPLVVGNETGGRRPYWGAIYLIAIYQRVLSGEEVRRNFVAGPFSTR